MRNIFFIGLVSFFIDISTEMVYPLIPLYLATFGAAPMLVGIIEGIAESTASLLKVYSGYLTDKSQKKKQIAFWGYSAGIFYKIALIFASSWVGILAARVVDRIGKGFRTAPRDVLVSESIDKENIGKAFGFHKALDAAGGAIGMLLTFFIITSLDGNYDFKTIFALSIIPGILGLCMFFFIKEKKIERPVKVRTAFWKDVGKIDNQLKLYLFVVFIFMIGNSSAAFQLLKAKDVGFSDVNIILLYFVSKSVAAVLSMPFGKLSDKIGRKNLLVPGYLAFSLCYFGFAFASSHTEMITTFVLFGIYTAMITGVERAFVAEIAPPALKGTMLGLHSTISGIALLPASIIAGALWMAFGAQIPFIFGASLSLIAAIILIIFMKSGKPNSVLSVN